jgi:hypothetical protein
LFVTQKTTCKRQFIVCDTEDNLQRAVYSLWHRRQLAKGSLFFVTQKTTCKRQFIVCDTEDSWTRNVTIVGSTHQLLLSVEDCGNFVSRTQASPSVDEVRYYMFEHLKCIDSG